MKKKLALLLSAVMIASMVPMTAFAISDNSVDRVVTSTTDKDLTTIPVLKLEKKNLNDSTATSVIFKLNLTNAEWKSGFGVSNIRINGTTATAPTAGTPATPGSPAETSNYEDEQDVAITAFTKGAAYTITDATKVVDVKVKKGPAAEIGTAVKFNDGAADFDVKKETVGSDVKYFYNDGTNDVELVKGAVKTYESKAAVAPTPAIPAGVGTTVTKLSDSSVIVEINRASVPAGDSKIEVDLLTKVKSEGDATVTIDPMQSVVSGGTYKFANVSGGSTITTIEKKNDLQEAGSAIKSIVITETAAGSLKGSPNGELKLKLTNGFSFENTGLSSSTFGAPTDGITVTSYPSLGAATVKVDSDSQELYIKFASLASTSFATTQAATISIAGLKVGYDEDDVNKGDVAEITVSGYDTNKTSIEVGTAVSYGVVVEAENKTVPEFVAGRYSDEDETLKVTFKETVKASWLDLRKTTITFPEGIKARVDSVTVKDGLTGSFTVDTEQKADKTEFTLPKSVTRNSDKVKVEFKFTISADPGFTGDVVATFGGAGLGDDQSVVIGKVVAPITVEAETNDVSIDYRNVAVGDIVIKEAAAGYLKKDTSIYLKIDELKFDGTPSVEVVEGDIKIDKVEVLSGSDKGILKIKIKTASNKTPAVLKVTDNKLFLDRSIPAGSYSLSLVETGATVAGTSNASLDNAIFQNYSDDTDKLKGKADTVATLNFDTDEVVVLKDFVEVITGGRDQAETFTTKIAVTIGADKLVAGKTEVALDVPAYISEGYTLLPVRAVTEALSTSAIVKWDDATKTATITFGSRIVNITVGSKTMNINGVPVQMAKAAEITDSRAFIPLRDLGYALGLNDSKINWDDATKTATLN